MGNHTVGIAILGAGRWGNHLIRNFLQHPSSRVVAIADPNRGVLHQTAHRNSVAPEVLLTANWHEAIYTSGVEAVAIATPASTHTLLIRAALEQGLHVLVEKPLTLDVNEAQELCHLAESQNLVLLVDHTYLFHPAISAAKATLQSASLGSLRYGYAARTHLGPVRSDVDALWDLAIHDIAIFNDWLGDRPCQAEATGTVWLQPQINASPLFPHGLPDVVWATLTYPSGVRATLHLCWLNPDKQRRLCLVGEAGTLVFDEMQPQPLTLIKGRLQQQGQQFCADSQNRVAIALDATEPLKQVCAYFLQCLASSSLPPFSNGRTGLDLIRVLTALSSSLNQAGHPVAIHYD